MSEDRTELVVGPLVSVALCTYNGARYLDAQMASVLAQTGVELEVVVGDDGSTDGTWEQLKTWAARDGRVKLHRNAERLGFSGNFASTMVRCRGEFIAPCDQDDVWHAQKLCQLVDAMGTHAMSYADSALVDDAGRSLDMRLSDRTRMYAGVGVLPLAFWNSVSGHAMLFRRTLLEQALPIPDGCFHDWWLAAVAASQGGIVHVPKALVDYRQHELSQTDAAQRRRGRRDSFALDARRTRWLEALATLPGPDQDYCQRLAFLWRVRTRQWFCPALVRHLAARRDELLRLNRRGRFGTFALKVFLGMRWRRRTHR